MESHTRPTEAWEVWVRCRDWPTTGTAMVTQTIESWFLKGSKAVFPVKVHYPMFYIRSWEAPALEWDTWVRQTWEKFVRKPTSCASARLDLWKAIPTVLAQSRKRPTTVSS